MNKQRALAITFVTFALFAASSKAETVSARMNVSVQVLARAVVTIDSQPATVEVTSEDIARGYVDVNEPILVRVRTNSRSGYVLQAEKIDESFAAIELSLPSASMNVASHESWLQRPYVAGGDVMPIRARLRLAPGATPGSRALPVSFSASPL